MRTFVKNVVTGGSILDWTIAMNDKDYCGMKNDEFENVVDIVKDEYNRLKKSIFDMNTPMECEYFAEQKIEEWNHV